MKKIRTLVVIVLILICFGGCKSADNNVSTTGTCTITIQCKTILNNMDKLDKSLKKHIPKDGIILKKTTVNIEKNDNAYTVLKRTLKENNILMEASFTGNSAYIEGIDNIYEFSCGDLSGWVYSINGEIGGKSCSDYKVKNGDDIQWMYTCNLGEDLKK